MVIDLEHNAAGAVLAKLQALPEYAGAFTSGAEAFLKMSYKNRLKDAVTAGDTMNFNHYEGKGMDINEIIGIADTMPFLQSAGWC